VGVIAQRLATDHSNLQNQVSSFASSHNMTLPTSTTQEQQNLVSQLSGLSGQGFDRQYIQTMLQEHQKDIAKVQQQLANTQDPAIQDLARKTLPVLENHMRLAENLAGQLGISAQPGLNQQ
jgi:putative membrane protein